MAQPCPGGAQPKPGLSSATVLLTLGALGVDILEHVSHIWPSLTAQTIWGRLDVATLCSQRPEDPGPPTPQDLAYTAILAGQAAGGSLGGAYGSWAWKQLVYQNFLNSCECVVVGETPPPRQPVPPPTGQPPYPTDHKDQDPLTRIENNQEASLTSLQQLYNGIQRTAAFASDLHTRLAQTDATVLHGAPFQISGEGGADLAPYNGPTTYSTQDVVGVRVQFSQLPIKWKVQGSLTPRYYGLGHVTFNGNPNSSQAPMITHRHALHYLDEFVAAPMHSQQWTLRWHLQPGAVATATQVFRNVDFPGYADWTAPADGYAQIGGSYMPVGWLDPPLYPSSAASSRRIYALGAPP